MDNQDKENLVKAGQTANLLVQDLQAMIKSKDSLLSDIAMELLKPVVEVELRLKRIGSVTK